MERERMARFGIMQVDEVREGDQTKYVIRNIRTGRDLEEFCKWKMAVEWAEANQNG